MTKNVNEEAREQLVRKVVGITAKDLAADLNIPYTSYCKFEKGKTFFSEARKRIIVEYLRVKQLEG